MTDETIQPIETTTTQMVGMDIINIVPPTTEFIWSDFVADGVVFIMDRLDQVDGPYSVGDMDAAMAQYVVRCTGPGSGTTQFRLVNPSTNYKLIVLPYLWKMVGKQLDV